MMHLFSDRHKNFFVLLMIVLVPVMISAQSSVSYAPMTINAMTAWYSSDGGMEITNGSPKAKPGAVFPLQTAGISYASGFWLAVGQPQVMAYGPFFNNSMQQGAIVGLQTGIAEDKSSASLRLWRIRKDFASADLRRDAAVTYSLAERSVSIMDMQRLRQQYKKDWLEWPAHRGAPYEDRNGNGIYDPKFVVNEFGVEVPDTSADEPGIAGADQVIWMVYNDLGGISTFGSAPLGMEYQVTLWAYGTSGPLNSAIFRRCRMIYKGTASTPNGHTLASMYAGVWSDIDLGQTNDDLAGSDSLAGLGYVYNSKVLDNQYSPFHTVPPAVGFDIVQGPAVKGTSIDSAVIGFSYKKGWRNLPVSSITYFSQNNFQPQTGPGGAQQVLNAMQGLNARQGTSVIDPTQQRPSRFWAGGDPLTRTGWVDGLYEGTGDRELLLSAGPFSMSLGDTQEIVTVLLGAHSADRLASVNVLKYHDKVIQHAYDRLHTASPVMPVPQMTVTELDRSLLIEWERDTAGINRTEKFNTNGYQFEGYELFQLPSPLSPREQWTKIAAYDLNNEITQITEEGIDPLTGRVGLVVRHDGSNSGIQRRVVLTEDAIDRSPLINGRTIHLALIAYAYAPNSGLLQRAVQSTPVIISAVPHAPDPGTILPYALNDSLAEIGQNIVGQNDGRIGIKILDPYAVTGGSYDLWYGYSGSAASWTLVSSIPGTDYAAVSARLTASELTLPRPNPLPTTTGTVTLTLNDAKDRIAYVISASTANTVTAIEISSGPKNSSGTLAKKFVTSDKTISGVWTMNDAAQPLTPKLVSDLIAGQLFVLVRTDKYPNGEMRGQIVDGLLPRKTLPTADFSTSDRSVFNFPENRFPSLGFSLYVSPAPIGFRSALQTAPSFGNVVNQPNPERTYSLIGPGYAWGASRSHESVIEFRFTSDTSWAFSTARIPAEVIFIRVPFAVYKDSLRVVPIVENTFTDDSVWNIRGNSFLNGQPLFDKIVGIADAFDFTGNPIGYDSVFAGGTFPSSISLRSRILNGVNHIAKNIVMVNVKGDGLPPAPGTVIQLTPYRSIKAGDVKRITLDGVQFGNTAAASTRIPEITVYPNPFYGANRDHGGMQNRFVTFSHLPERAVVRIFNLAGSLVRTLEKQSSGQFLQWDLKNHKGNFVASGIYLAYIEMDGVGSTVVKVAVIMEHQQINSY